MNAIGDATLALGLVLLIWETGTLEFVGVFEDVDSLSSTTVNLVALGLLGGAVAKSAQIPLHTWLPGRDGGPDARLGADPRRDDGHRRRLPPRPREPDLRGRARRPAPRRDPRRDHALVAGVIALVQWDIKRVIAYSTMSQIGYMFLAAGIGAYGYAIFHLMTHAFFKALLFMTAGVVIHHLGGEQDIRKMGGLKTVMPRTHVAFLVGTLALAGIPIFAGFWSKDGIVAAAFASGDALGYTLYVAGLVGALLTGLYTFRLYFAVFRGEPSELVQEHTHEGTARGRCRCSSRSASSPCSRRSAASSSSPASGSRSCTGSTRRPSRSSHATVAEDYGTSAIAVSLGLIGFFLARRAFRAGPPARHEPRRLARARAQALLRRGVRRALLPSRRRAVGRAPAERRGARRRALARRDRLGDDPGRRRGRARPVRAPPHVRRRHRLLRRRPRRRLRGGALSDADDRAHPPADRRRARRRDPPAPAPDDRGLAFLVALMEVGLWIVAAARSTSTTAACSSGRRASGSRASGSRTRSASTASRSGSRARPCRLRRRDRLRALGRAGAPRAYHALMLFLLGAVVATFAAQDLLLFYVSFEAMLIPLYVLVGVWGGERRQAATVTFVIYTMAGSLLMLASVVAFGVTQGTFSLTESGTSDNVWIFLGFAIAFAVKAPLFPFHGWLPLAYREAPVEVAAVLSAVVSKTAIYGFLRIGIPKFPEPADDLSGLILVLACAGLVYGSLLAFRAPTSAVSSRTRRWRRWGSSRSASSRSTTSGSTARSSSRSRTGSSPRACSSSSGWSSGAAARATSMHSAGWRAGGRRSRPSSSSRG